MKMNLGWYVPMLLYNIRMGALFSKTDLKGALVTVVELKIKFWLDISDA